MTEPVNYFIVSKRPAFRELMRFVLEWQFECKVITSDSESAALEYLRATEIFPNLIVYEYESDAFLIEDFIVSIKESGKPVHFLVLADKISGPAANLFDSFPRFHLVKKEDLWTEVFQLTRESFKDVVADNHHPWCRIHLDGLQALQGADNDLYIKLGPDKFVRLFESGNAEDKDLEKYRTKGVAFMWLPRPTCNWMVEQIQAQFHIFLQNHHFQFVMRPPGASKESQYEQKIMRVCGELHMDPQYRKEIEQLMDKVLEVVRKDVKLGNLVRLIRSGDPRLSYFMREMQLMSLISCYLAKALEWNSKVTLEKLVYASILHDITLAMKPQLQCIATLRQLEEAELSEEDKKFYLIHTKEAAQLIKSNFRSAPPETEILVLQHHELPDGSGFPGKVMGERLSPLVQLFVVAHDFVHFVMESDEPSLDEYFLRADTRFSHNAFRKHLALLKKFRAKK